VVRVTVLADCDPAPPP